MSEKHFIVSLRAREIAALEAGLDEMGPLHETYVVECVGEKNKTKVNMRKKYEKVQEENWNGL